MLISTYYHSALLQTACLHPRQAECCGNRCGRKTFTLILCRELSLYLLSRGGDIWDLDQGAIICIILHCH